MADMDNVYSVSPVLEESVSQVTATNSVDLGTRVQWRGEEYVYCYNAGGATIATGNGVKFVTGASGDSVAATSLTDVANPCVGVCHQTEADSADYFWVMTRGFRNVVMVSATTADYVPIALGAGGKFVQHSPLTDAAHVGTYNVAGYAINADTAAAGSVYALINTGF
jgi:hypothetical protein